METKDSIIIEQEQAYKSRWIKVYVPHFLKDGSSVSIQTRNGAVLKRLSLNEGYNAIDISSIDETTINIKVETPFETILKEIKTNEQ